MRKWYHYIIFLTCFPLNSFSFFYLYHQELVQMDDSLSSRFGYSSSFSYMTLEKATHKETKTSSSYFFILLRLLVDTKHDSLTPFSCFLSSFSPDVEKKSTQRVTKCIILSKNCGTEVFPGAWWSQEIRFMNVEHCEN